ncbi:MAG: Fur family transcriptional regulator [Saprospiraceae bacterium]
MSTEQILVEHDLRKTKVRVAVLETYLDKKVAISHPEMEAMHPDLDRVTLFRTLKTFEEKGIIHQAIDGTAATKYALCHSDCSEHHHLDNHAHFHCTKCGDTTCLEHIVIPPVELPAGYQMGTSQLVMQGKCPKCN